MRAARGAHHLLEVDALDLRCTPPSLKIVKMVRPTLPPEAKPSDVVGIAAVEVEIDKAGVPTSIKVLKGNPVAANAVVMAVKQWRWKPLKRKR